MRDRPNDVGGENAGPIDLEDHEAADWQVRLTAVVNCLGQFGGNVVRIDEFRRSREDLEPALFDHLPYFEQWTLGLANIVVEKGILSADEIRARMDELRHKARRGTG